jgi:hypothetical protein
VFNGTCRAGFLRNSLKLRRSSAIIGLEFHWSASGKVLKPAELPFINGECEIILERKFSGLGGLRYTTLYRNFN